MEDRKIIYEINEFGGYDYIKNIKARNKQEYLREKYKIGSLSKAQQIVTVFKKANLETIKRIIDGDSTISAVVKEISNNPSNSRKIIDKQICEIFISILNDNLVYENNKYAITNEAIFKLINLFNRKEVLSEKSYMKLIKHYCFDCSGNMLDITDKKAIFEISGKKYLPEDIQSHFKSNLLL